MLAVSRGCLRQGWPQLLSKWPRASLLYHSSPASQRSCNQFYFQQRSVSHFII